MPAWIPPSASSTKPTRISSGRTRSVARAPPCWPTGGRRPTRSRAWRPHPRSSWSCWSRCARPELPLEDLAWARGDVETALSQKEAADAAATLVEAATAADAALGARAREVADEVREAIRTSDDLAWRVDAVLPRVADVTPPTGRGPRPFQKARKDLTEALERLRGVALDDLAERELVAPLLLFFRELERTYARLKDERNVLDFTDLETRALALLEGLAAEGRRPAHAPEALLVDEYQDTNPLQARILAHLRHASCPLFAVGDPKQSIYRFRGADVRVIQDEHEAVGAEGRHLLRATFRASPSLVDCINGLDEAIFADEAAGVEHVPLESKGDFLPGDGPDVDLRVVDVGAGQDAATGREAQAHTIAAWIRDLVARRERRAKQRPQDDAEASPPQPLGYGDVAILVRARSMIPTLEDALQRLGIPFLTYKGRGFFQAEEIVDLLHVLRVIQDPADDFALACLLTGPLVSATDEDLLKTFADRERATDPPGKPWATLRAAAEVDERLARLCERIEALRREASAGRLGRVVEGVLYDLGLMEAALLQDDGRRRAANLRKSLVVARKLEQGGLNDLGDLLRRLSLVRDREIAESEAAIGQEGEDVVRINTVHSAKGLEYPVVVLADVQRTPPSSRGAARFDGGRRWSVKLRHPLEGGAYVPAGFAALVEEDKRRQAEEDRRLLYVAMTRAEERLLVVGHAKGSRKDGYPSGWKGWGEILLDALGGQVGSDAAWLPLGEGGRVRLQSVDPPAVSPGGAEVRAAATSTDEARAEARRVLAAAAAPVDPLGATPFVVTVTDLLHFAHSPAAFYARLLEPQDLPVLRAVGETDDPASGEEHTAPDAAREIERRLLFDEVPDPAPPAIGIDRAALGRAFHRVAEGLQPGGCIPSALDAALVAEFPAAAHAPARALLQAMVDRLLASPTGTTLMAQLAAGADLRREVAFHARIRFPAGEQVGPFDSLLVRGAIDLWLPAADGIRIVDFKTNVRSPSFPTPESWADHYAEQVRLYALAAERILGTDVAGASLLLVDPSWEGDAIEVEVDVSGGALEDTRRLCRAYAQAALDGRWPDDWRRLLDEPG